MKKYQMIIVRQKDAESEPVIQTYEFEAEDREVMSIMDGLEYIYQNIDPTLAFFHHAACNQAACGKCLVKANGKLVLACKERLKEGGVKLEPAYKTVICDLVSKQDWHTRGEAKL